MHGWLALQRAAVHGMHFLVPSLNHLLFLLIKYLLEVFDDNYFVMLKNNFFCFCKYIRDRGGEGGCTLFVLFLLS